LIKVIWGIEIVEKRNNEEEPRETYQFRKDDENK
jgi:hypothetical protein